MSPLLSRNFGKENQPLRRDDVLVVENLAGSVPTGKERGGLREKISWTKVFCPLANGGFCGIIITADLGGRKLPLDWLNLVGKRGRKPVDEEVGTPFYRNTSTFQDANGTRVNYALTGRILPCVFASACGRATVECMGSNRYALFSCTESSNGGLGAED